MSRRLTAAALRSNGITKVAALTSTRDPEDLGRLSRELAEHRTAVVSQLERVVGDLDFRGRLQDCNSGYGLVREKLAAHVGLTLNIGFELTLGPERELPVEVVATIGAPHLPDSSKEKIGGSLS